MYSIKTMSFGLFIVAAIMISVPVEAMKTNTSWGSGDKKAPRKNDTPWHLSFRRALYDVYSVFKDMSGLNNMQFQPAATETPIPMNDAWPELMTAIKEENLNGVKKLVPKPIEINTLSKGEENLFQIVDKNTQGLGPNKDAITEYLYEQLAYALKKAGVTEIKLDAPAISLNNVRLAKCYSELGFGYKAQIKMDGKDYDSIETYLTSKTLPEGQEFASSVLKNPVLYACLKKATFAKFNQHPHLKKILLTTTGLTLKDGSDKNEFGKVIMDVRSQLQPVSVLGWLARAALVAAGGYVAWHYSQKPAATK